MRGTASGIKPENSFSALSPLSPTVDCFAPHSHPSPPEEKAASRKKSRLRRKKTSPTANSWASCVSRDVYPCRMDSRHNRPRLIALGLAVSKLRFRLRLACMDLLTILACVVKHAVQRSLYGRLFCTNTRNPCHSR